jgi:predicted nucleic acid-binding protein
LSLDQALSRVQSWLDQPTRIIHPTDRHWIVFRKCWSKGRPLRTQTDAHLAALASEHGCELISTDTDFALPGVKWKTH